jgi:hypothetical protein
MALNTAALYPMNMEACLKIVGLVPIFLPLEQPEAKLSTFSFGMTM